MIISFASILQALVENGKSFEEVRIDDYIQSYMSSGHPPRAVAQVPTGDRERLALGLPPLFKPIAEHHPILAGRPIDGFIGSRKTNPANIPATQDFKEEKMGTETLVTICYSEPYSHFSPEELRYHAYQKGHKFPPLENLQSITIKPEFSQHSFEELRVMHMLADRKLNSAEITTATVASRMPSSSAVNLKGRLI